MRCTIGIDQSYTCTGVAVAVAGEIKATKAIEYGKDMDDIEKRFNTKAELLKTMYACRNKGFSAFDIIYEKPRINAGRTPFEFIKMSGAMEAEILETFWVFRHQCDIAMYAVPTQTWKKAVIGTTKPDDSRPGFDPQKVPTYEWLVEHVPPRFYMTRTDNKRLKHNIIEVNEDTRFLYNDNKGDAICIALYMGTTDDFKAERKF